MTKKKMSCTDIKLINSVRIYVNLDVVLMKQSDVYVKAYFLFSSVFINDKLYGRLIGTNNQKKLNGSYC